MCYVGLYTYTIVPGSDCRAGCGAVDTFIVAEESLPFSVDNAQACY